MERDLKKEDLISPGEILINDDGCVAILMAGLCDVDMILEREILIRNVLKLFGDQYKIVSMSDVPVSEKGKEHLMALTVFNTNLPWNMIEEYLDDDEFHF